MLNQITICAITLGIAAYISNAAADQHGRKLTGDEIRTVTSDSTSLGVSQDGYSYTIYRSKDGEVRGYAGRSFNPRQYYDEGEWAIIDDRYCVRYSEWRKGERRCYVMYHLGGNKYRGDFVGGYDDVVKTHSKPEWHIVPGNPEDL